MNSIQNWGQAITSSLFGLWQRFMDFVPTLVGAILIFLIGLAIASILGKIVERIVKALRVDHAVERMEAGTKLREHGMRLNFSKIFGKLVQWFLILVFLMAATDILGLKEVTTFLNSILLYLPNVIVATIILTIAFLLSNLMYSIVRSSTRAAGVFNANVLASIVRWAIVIFGLLAALIQLGVATSLVNTIFIGLVAAISLATGLAFGLGGREEAAMLIQKMRENMTRK